MNDVVYEEIKKIKQEFGCSIDEAIKLHKHCQPWYEKIFSGKIFYSFVIGVITLFILPSIFNWPNVKVFFADAKKFLTQNKNKSIIQKKHPKKEESLKVRKPMPKGQ